MANFNAMLLDQTINNSSLSVASHDVMFIPITIVSSQNEGGSQVTITITEIVHENYWDYGIQKI